MFSKTALFYLITMLLSVPPAFAQDQAGVNKHFKKLKEAYFDVAAQYPTAYTCRMESPEIVDSMDMKTRHAWGPKGHIVITKTANSFRLTAGSVRDLNAKPLFNLVLGLWQIRLAIEMKQLESRMPGNMANLALLALSAPNKFTPVEETRKDLLRFGVRAKGKKEKLQELLFVVDKNYELKAMTYRDNKGDNIQVGFQSRKHKWSTGKLVIEQIKAKAQAPEGNVSNWQADLSYQTAGKNKDYVVYKQIRTKATDAKGKPIKKSAKDVNPISYEFEKYDIQAGSAAKRVREPAPHRKGTNPYSGFWVPTQ